MANKLEEALECIRKAEECEKNKQYYEASLLYSKGCENIILAARHEVDNLGKNDIWNEYKTDIDIWLAKGNELGELIKAKKTGEFEWRIPGLSQNEMQLLCEGYVRNNAFMRYVPNDIINICMIFYDDKLIEEIKTADNRQSLASNTFNIGPFKLKLVIYPNGHTSSTKGKFLCFIKLVSLSPSITDITFYYKISVPQLDIIYEKFSKLSRHKMSNCWSIETLQFDKINSLDANIQALNFKLEMNIIKIGKNDGTSHQYDENEENDLENDLRLIQNPSLKTAFGIYIWSVSDLDIIREIKNSEKNSDYMVESRILKMHGFKFYIDFYPNDSIIDEKQNCNLYLNIISLPPNISMVVIEYQLQCIQFNAANYSNIAVLTSEDSSCGWSNNTLIISQIKQKRIDKLTFKVGITLIDVYDRDGYVITDKYIDIKEDDENDINNQIEENKLCGSYEWQIRNNLMNDIKNTTENVSFFYSSIFKIQSFKWIMRIVPMSDILADAPHINWYLYLASFPSQIEEICFKYKIILEETGTVHTDIIQFKASRSCAWWGPEKLKSEIIHNLDQMTFKLDIKILDVYDKNGNTLYDFKKLLESPILEIIPQEFIWTLTDIEIINDMKHAKNGIVFESQCFMLFGFKWFLSIFPNGKNTEDENAFIVSLNLKEFDKNISAISFHFEMLLIETNTMASIYANFRENFKSIGFTKYRLKTVDIQNLDKLTIKIKIKLVDVYDDNGHSVTYKYKNQQ